MKMETEITAPKAGTVARILVEKGTPVQAGEALVELD
jgi:methylmalonyl-CoA carboxyltransferase small subunit